MSNIHKDDIVEFFHENGESGYGYVIQVHQTDAIDALVVAVFDAYGKILMIPRHRVKETWRNLRGYVTDCQILQAEVERLKAALTDMCEMWSALEKQIPPLLIEQKYLNATAVLVNAPAINAGSTEAKQ